LKKIDYVKNKKKIDITTKKWSNQETGLDENERRKKNVEEKNKLRNCRKEKEKVWRINFN
jgi:hypothetical protein